MINWLNNSRIAAVGAVVFLHVSASIVFENDIGSGAWWIGNIYDSVSRWCVPVLVMISGALLLDESKQEDATTFYRKRLSRIFWPILFWSAFYLFWVFIKGFIKGSPPSFNTLALSLLSGKPYIHMWFLYMMIGLYIFTPFFRKLIARSSVQELTFFIAVTFALSAISAAYHAAFPADGPELFCYFFLYYIPYFFMGHMIRTTSKIPSKGILAAILVTAVGLTALGCYLLSLQTDLPTGLYFLNFLSISVIPMSISVMYLLKTWEKPIFQERTERKIASLTLGVYLIHPIFLEIINYLKLSPFANFPLASIPITTVMVFSISLLAAWIISLPPFIRRII